ncbi:MAG: hypothetical protein KC620_11345 [Myxococcales bacterium]|nr:hypothetical protein [Myxococcales bacterium]
MLRTHAMWFLAASSALACASSPAARDCVPDPPKPAWVERPGFHDHLAATGLARSKGGTAYARDKAMTAARDQIARMIDTRVRNLTDTFFREGEIDGSGGRAEAFTKYVSRQVSTQTLAGSRPEQFWTNECTGEVAVLLVLDEGLVRRAMQSAASDGARELDIVDAQAQKALRGLDEQLARDAAKSDAETPAAAPDGGATN